MKKLLVRIATPAALGVVMACSSGGGTASGTEDAAPSVNPTESGETYSKDVGLATIGDLRRHTESILQRYQYEIVRFDEGAYTFIETRWRPRQILEDEQALGIVAAQTRISIQTRLRSRATNPTLAVHRVTFTAENQVQFEIDGQWTRGVVTEEFEEYAGRIAQQFETEFRAGLRRND